MVAGARPWTSELVNVTDCDNGSAESSMTRSTTYASSETNSGPRRFWTEPLSPTVTWSGPLAKNVGLTPLIVVDTPAGVAWTVKVSAPESLFRNSVPRPEGAADRLSSTASLPPLVSTVTLALFARSAVTNDLVPASLTSSVCDGPLTTLTEPSVIGVKKLALVVGARSVMPPMFEYVMLA